MVSGNRTHKETRGGRKKEGRRRVVRVIFHWRERGIKLIGITQKKEKEARKVKNTSVIHGNSRDIKLRGQSEKGWLRLEKEKKGSQG